MNPSPGGATAFSPGRQPRVKERKPRVKERKPRVKERKPRVAERKDFKPWKGDSRALWLGFKPSTLRDRMKKLGILRFRA